MSGSTFCLYYVYSCFLLLHLFTVEHNIKGSYDHALQMFHKEENTLNMFSQESTKYVLVSNTECKHNFHLDGLHGNFRGHLQI